MNQCHGAATNRKERHQILVKHVVFKQDDTGTYDEPDGQGECRASDLLQDRIKW
jgi:hypothetical protein